MNISNSLAKIQEELKKCDLEALYVSSFDAFLSEYVPLDDCPRYFVTGFSGSVAEVLIPQEGRAYLFVDGRYHQQAHLEVDESLVEVVEVAYGVSLLEALIDKMKELKLLHVGVLDSRTPFSYYQNFSLFLTVINFDFDTFVQLTSMPGFSNDCKILNLIDEETGEGSSEKIDRILEKGEGYFVTSLDSLAWISNCRAFQLPYQSTFTGVGLVTKNGVFIFAPDSVVESFEVLKRDDLFVHSFSQMEEVLFGEAVEIEKLYVDESNISLAFFDLLKKTFGPSKLKNKKGGLLNFHMFKNETEIEQMKIAFDHSDTAIYQTLKWTKENSQGLKELDFYYKCNEFYKEQGALAQSFKTIAAFGTNSSIVHFSNPSDDKVYQDGEMILLDSGAFYRSGLATDTTRTFLGHGQASDQQKLIYTTVMRSLLTVLNSRFTKGCKGMEVDKVARGVVQSAGFDYAHGTGHGVGINVHEGGFSLTPSSEVPLQVGTVGSVEPGIYIPEIGGVRLENIVQVVEDGADSIKFESLVYIGFDYDLIDQSLLSEEEKSWFEAYENECAKRGRSFRRPSSSI